MADIRIATYNIHKARGLDGRTRVERIAAVLAEVGADVAALQEVLGEQAEELARRLGLRCAFSAARTHRGAAYGNATLSRWEFERVLTTDLTTPGREARAALRTDLRLPGGTRVHIFNVHLGTGWRERRQQAPRLTAAGLLRTADLAGPRIILGDFNEWTQGLVTRTLRAEFHESDLRPHLGHDRGYPALLPLLAVDHIYCDRHLEVERAWHHRSRRALIASDHTPLVAELSLADPSTVPPVA